MYEPDMKALDELLGSAKALEGFDKKQRLELELRTIGFWDAHYHANPNRDSNDICAFQARQIRKQEILQEIRKSEEGNPPRDSEKGK